MRVCVPAGTAVFLGQAFVVGCATAANVAAAACRVLLVPSTSGWMWWTPNTANGQGQSCDNSVITVITPSLAYTRFCCVPRSAASVSCPQSADQCWLFLLAAVICSSNFTSSCPTPYDSKTAQMCELLLLLLAVVSVASRPHNVVGLEW